MTWQEGFAYGAGLLALAYLVRRALRRRAAGTCCGEEECPAAKLAVRKLRVEAEASGPVEQAHTPHTDL